MYHAAVPPRDFGRARDFMTQIADGRGQRVPFIESGQLRKAEVSLLDRAVFADQDVGRLEIPVDDAARVRRRDGVGHRNRWTQHLARPQTTCWNQRVEACAVDEFRPR